MLQFPTEHEAWKKFVHQEMKAQLTDIQRLWKRLPQRPDDPWGFIGGVTDIDIGTLPPGTLGTGTLGTTNTTNTINTGGTNTLGTDTVNTGGTNTFATVGGSICSGCTSVPLQWSMNVSGITDNTCNICTLYNGAYTLTNVPGLCRWESPSQSICNGVGTPGTGARWVLFRFGLNWQLRAVGIGGAVLANWQLSQASFACMGVNVMPSLSTTTNCSNWPANITLNPG
jgi:hypothetical protein